MPIDDAHAACRQALSDAYGETARTADELAFWKYQAIWHRAAWGNQKQILNAEDPAATPAWKEAEHQLEQFRQQENRERYSPEAPRDLGTT
jgi:hypothetical protein